MDGKYYKFARGKKETPKILKEIQHVIAAKKTILVQTGSTDNLMINEMYTTNNIKHHTTNAKKTKQTPEKD